MDFVIILIFGFAVMWLLIVLPQRRRQRTHEQMVGKLARGDYVVTNGGLYGTIVDVGEDDLGLEVAPDVEVRVARRAIAAIVPPEQIEDVEVEDEPTGSAVDGNRG